MEDMAIPRKASASSSSDEFGMDFYPLLSPPTMEEGEGEKESSSSQWPPAPLFLKLMCRVGDEEGGGKSQVTTVEGLPLCLSKRIHNSLLSAENSVVVKVLTNGVLFLQRAALVIYSRLR